MRLDALYVTPFQSLCPSSYSPCPLPLILGQDRLENSPPLGQRGRNFPGVYLGGMVRAIIELYIGAYVCVTLLYAKYKRALKYE